MANEGFREALNGNTPDESIMSILRFLGETLHGERSYIFERNENGNDDNTYEWCAPGVTPAIDTLQDLPAEVCANWYNLYATNRIVMYRDIEEFRESDPLQYENLKQQDIHSIVTVPLYDKGKIIGFYGVDNPPSHDLEATSNMLQIVSHFIVAQLRNRNLIRQLHKLSRRDHLTGLGNRYALYDFVMGLQPEESVAVVYADITGLKEVNDTQGHTAGDQLILRARDTLKAAFAGREEGIFRVGGDEMVVICPGIGEQQLQDCISDLRKKMTQHLVTIAVGCAWRSRCSGRIDSLMDEAEKVMYKDKADWYRAMGRDRRHWAFIGGDTTVV